MKMKLEKVISVLEGILVILFCVLANIAFSSYLSTSRITRDSGEMFLDREEYVFSDILRSPQDYIEQRFQPKRRGLEQIQIRLAINYAGLTDHSLVRIELCQGEEVIQSEDVTNEQIKNWHYYNFILENELDTTKEYSIRIRQLEGPKREGADQYWISYVIFRAVEHVSENAPCYYYNGEEMEGEFEVVYQYHNSYRIWQILADVIFVAVFLSAFILKKRIPLNPKIKKIIVGILYVLLPAIVFLTVEIIAGDWLTITLENKVRNLFLYYVLLILLSFLFKRFGTLAFVYITSGAILGLLQYFVLLFRGRVFMLQDVLAWKTAAIVADTYTYSISLPQFLLIMILLSFLSISIHITEKAFTPLLKMGFVAGIAGCIILTGVIGHGYLLELSMWNLTENYTQGGVLLSLVSEIPYMKGKKPEGYSISAVEHILEKIETTTQKEHAVVPENLIVIMNESFADLEYIGDVSASTELLPYIHSMSENVIKGYLNVPVFGGGTANTEYEVLTGNSTAFLTEGSFAYQMNVAAGEYGMASTLKAQNYTAIAVHPYYAEGWNRNNVYQYMKFDDFLALEDIEETWELDKIRGYVSDESSYCILTDLCRDTAGELFTFLVTMQNHGGYTTEYNSFDAPVYLDYDDSYPQAELYLSLMRESDRAFKELTDYCSCIDEPTMIVMFGDHQVSLEDKFYEEVFGQPSEGLSFVESQNRYVTPFIIWTNYDIEEEFDVRMSSNYFGSYVMSIAGVQMPPYNKFLLGLQKEIPIIGKGGVCDKNGIWYEWDDMPENCRELIEEYKILQYNNIFDRKNRVNRIFDMGLWMNKE